MTMITNTDTTDPHIRLEPSECFWALLDADASRAALRASGSRGRSIALGHLFDESLPVPIEDVHAVYVRTRNGAYVACGLPVQAVREHLDAGALTLVPSRLPKWLDADTDSDTLNLLLRPYEPATVKRSRRRWNLHLVVLLFALVGVVIAGHESRRAGWLGALGEIKAAEQSLYDDVLPTSNSVQPDALRLTAELRRLRQTRRGPGDTLAPPRADDRLALVLASWPPSLDARAELVTVTPDTITCQVIVPDADAAASLAEALGEMPGWRPQQPQIRTQRDAVRTTIRLEQIDQPREASP